MPYVPQDVKERIKREVSIQRLAEARGIKLTRSGKELIGLCPFHDDHSPSLNIDPAKNVWSCKGACGEGEELMNRCLVLAVNEDREQTQAIHQKQREAQTLEGLKARTRRNKIVRLHRNAQRLLRPVDVVIECLKERRFPDAMTRTRRDHMKFLTLIQAITLLHQHQREIKTSVEEDVRLEYIEATEADVKLAWELASNVGR
jgi:hypothetical protein